jgi:hypothetical protein
VLSETLYPGPGGEMGPESKGSAFHSHHCLPIRALVLRSCTSATYIMPSALILIADGTEEMEL